MFRKFSSILSELFCPFYMFLDIFVVDWRFDSGKSLHKVVKTNWWASEELWLHIHQTHVCTFWIGREGWSPATICCLFKPLCGLAFSNWHHESFINHNGTIWSWVTLWFISKDRPIIVRKTVLGFITLVLENTSSGSCIWERNIDTLLETTTNSIIKLPWYVSSSKHKNTVHAITHTLHLH